MCTHVHPHVYGHVHCMHAYLCRRPHHTRRARATAARPDGAEDVSAWARDQLAWVMGDRAKEVAALPSAAPASGSTRDRDDAPVGRNINAASNTANASGAVADGGGWFRDNMVQGWTRYQAAQRLAEPGYRPDLGLAAGTR